MRRRLGQAFVAHPPASRHVVVRKLDRRERHLVGHPFVPIRAQVRRGDELVDDRTPFALERLDHMRNIVACLGKRPIQRDRIVEREARPRADRKMTGAKGVADQHDLARRPIRATDQRKVAP